MPGLRPPLGLGLLDVHVSSAMEQLVNADSDGPAGGSSTSGSGHPACTLLCCAPAARPCTSPLPPPRPSLSRARSRQSKRVKLVRDIVREVAGQAPYEKRLMELLKVGKDKRALKVAKRKVRAPRDR